MIRLKDILLEYEDSHERQLNVLFVVDDQSLKKFGFIRHMISQRVVVGEIESADKQNSESLKDIVVTQATPELDLIVVISRGIYDDEPLQVARNFDIIDQYTKTLNVPVIYFSIPTIRFLSDKSKLSNNWSEIERIKLNNILQSNFDNVVNVSMLDQDEYFKKDGFSYNLNAHLTLYEMLFRVILQFDSEATPKEMIEPMDTDASKLQQTLINLGYDIDQDDIITNTIGISTMTAVNQWRRSKGYPPSENITKSTSKGISLDTDYKRTCPDPKYPGAKQKYAPEFYNDINGIASKQSLSTIYGVTLRSDAAVQYKLMIDAMAKENIAPIGSRYGFRSYQKQYDLFDWSRYECTGIKKTKKGNTQAFPGRSNHGMGLAVDLYGTAAQNWIKSNGEKYGWSWDEGKRAGEAWHFRFDPRLVQITSPEDETGVIDKVTDQIPQLKVIKDLI